MLHRNSGAPPRIRTPLARLVLASALAFAALACAVSHPLTAAELAEHGTHRYPGIDRAKLTEACATALAALGYNVTLQDPRSGIVKTAPKVLAGANAKGSGPPASAMEDSLGWNVTVEGSGNGAIIHATPRAFRNGAEVRGENGWAPGAIDAKLEDLWHEVDGTLKVAPSSTN